MAQSQTIDTADAADRTASPLGLTSEAARRRLAAVGPNPMPDTAANLWRMASARFWAPVPWMLELAVVVELVVGDLIQAAVIAALLVFNGILGFLQESRAQATLDALRERLAISASVRRDGSWQTVAGA
jgi:H+-transporting ATPase